MIGEHGIIRTPWRCKHIAFTQCMLMVKQAEVGEHQCPQEQTLCCYFCGLNTSCCDRCPELTVTEDDFE